MARVVSIAGGKGGVGKSLVAANLAVAFARTGRKVILVDGDLGAANQHTLLGVDRPGPTLHGIFTKEIERLEEALVDTAVPGLSLVPGSGAVTGAANIVHTQKLKLLRQIRALPAEVVVVDCGAGASYNVLDLLLAGDQRVLVVTPQLTSLSNAYACVKGAVYRSIQEVGPSPETQKIGQLLARVRGEDPARAAAIQERLDGFGAWIVGNQVADPRQEGTLFAMTRMIHDFLGVRAQVAGWIPTSPRIEASVNRRRPFVLDGDDAATRAVEGIAGRLLAAPPAAAREPSLEAPPPLRDDEALPTDLGPYQRRAERHTVDWPALLERAGGAVAVRVRDVSLGGALVEPPGDLAVGERATLRFEGLPGRPALSVVVRYFLPSQRRGGVEFEGGPEAAERIVAAARA